jgi:hypothetical protein
MSTRSHVKHVLVEQSSGLLLSSIALDPGPARPSVPKSSTHSAEPAHIIGAMGSHACSVVHRSVTSTRCSDGLLSCHVANAWRTIWCSRSHVVHLIGGANGQESTSHPSSSIMVPFIASQKSGDMA